MTKAAGEDEMIRVKTEDQSQNTTWPDEAKESVEADDWSTHQPSSTCSREEISNNNAEITKSADESDMSRVKSEWPQYTSLLGKLIAEVVARRQTNQIFFMPCSTPKEESVEPEDRSSQKPPSILSYEKSETPKEDDMSSLKSEITKWHIYLSGHAKKEESEEPDVWTGQQLPSVLSPTVSESPEDDDMSSWNSELTKWQNVSGHATMSESPEEDDAGSWNTELTKWQNISGHAETSELPGEDNMGSLNPELTNWHRISGHEICPFQRLCLTFRDSLNIAEQFFDPAYDMCYCNSCHIQRGDEYYYSRGEPPKWYAIPVGWARFAVRCEPRAEAMNVFATWHRAYHGTDPAAVVHIFNTGNLVSPGNEVINKEGKIEEGPGHYNDEWKPQGFDTKQVFVSPSIVYAGNNLYATPTTFKDPTGSTYSAQTVLQVCIKPNSYSVGRHTIDGWNVDPLFDDNELEWSTRQCGAIIIYGLLIRLTEK